MAFSKLHAQGGSANEITGGHQKKVLFREISVFPAFPAGAVLVVF